MSDTKTVKIHKVVFSCLGTAVGKMRNDLTVKMVQPWSETYAMATDEGKYLGGEGTAPSPLALFVASLVGCIMTQIRSSAKRSSFPLNDLEVEAIVEWEAHQVENNFYQAMPKGFRLDIDIDSDAPFENVKKLLGAARKSCFIEQTLGCKNAIQHRLRNDAGVWIEI